MVCGQITYKFMGDVNLLSAGQIQNRYDTQVSAYIVKFSAVSAFCINLPTSPVSNYLVIQMQKHQLVVASCQSMILCHAAVKGQLSFLSLLLIIKLHRCRRTGTCYSGGAGPEIALLHQLLPCQQQKIEQIVGRFFYPTFLTNILLNLN